MGVNSLQIIVDAMGGDNAPYEIVKGAIQAVKSNESIKVVLVGDSERIKKIINEQGCRETLFEIIHTSEVILNEDAPTKAIKSKKDSSMVVGLNMLKNNRECAFISAGNTGALMTGSLLILGRIKGVDRPALAPVYTTKKGLSMLIDAGLNTTCKPLNYLQFGIIGSISISNSSSKAIINSTISSESAPKSSINDDSKVISSSSTPSCSTIIFFTFSNTMYFTSFRK